MPFCPKCEQEYREGFTKCHECGSPLVQTIERKPKMQKIEEDFAAAMFPDDVELTHFCQVCLNEFAGGAVRCSPCGEVRLTDATRPEYSALLDMSPLERHYLPAELRSLDDFVLVKKVKSPGDAAFLVAQMEEMGLTITIGSDLSDKFEDPSLVGLYVPADEVESAQMLLPSDDELGEEELIEVGNTSAMRPYERLIARAEGYKELQKYAFAIILLGEAITMKPERFEAYVALGRLFAEVGKTDRALEMFAEVRAILGDKDTTEAAFAIAVMALRDDDRKLVAIGAAAERAMLELKFFVQRHPRMLDALKLLLEAQAARGDKTPGKATVAQIKKVNIAFMKDAPRYEACARIVEV